MSAITPVTSMPADSASPSGMLTSALPQVRVQASSATYGSRVTVLQKNEGGVWFKVPQSRVLHGKSIKEAFATLDLAAGAAGEIVISNDFGSNAYHVLEENGGYAGNEDGTVTAYIAGASAPVTAGDLSSSNMVASGTLTVGGAATLSAAATVGTTLGVTGATTLSSTLAVTGATTATGVVNANGGVTLAGSAASAAADKVSYGIVDINGATTAADKRVYEGGGTLTERQASTSGAEKCLHYDETMADDATISLPVPTASHVGMLILSQIAEGGMVAIQSDGTCTKIAGSSNLEVTDSDTDLCVFNDSGTPKIKNRLGGARWIMATYRWS